MSAAPVPRTSVILVTDCGADMDDQWTLAQIALAPELELRSVVTTHAPTLRAPSAETSASIAREVLSHMPLRTRPPVFAGSSVPLPDKPSPLPNAGVSLILEQSRAFSPERRLVVLVTGAATDVASALLLDETLADRIEIIAMGFERWPEGGDSWNVKNDRAAWRVILAARVPLSVGDAAVTKRDLTITRDRARELFAGRGETGKYLVSVLEGWLNREPELCRKVTGRPDAWPIWDQVVVAHLLGLTQSKTYPRPLLREDLSFTQAPAASQKQSIVWIDAVDSKRLWEHFTKNLEHASSP